MKRYLLFAFACAGFSVLCPLATAQGSKDPVAPTASPELGGPERDGRGGDVAVPFALHRPHHQGLVGDRP